MKKLQNIWNNNSKNCKKKQTNLSIMFRNFSALIFIIDRMSIQKINMGIKDFKNTIN